MSVSLLAFSVSPTFTKIGAIVAFAGLLGIAVLSLLVFSQAREIRRLREWAGRAPERAADMEQRVSAAAAAKVQHGGNTGVRQVPRTQPIHARPGTPGAATAGQAAAPGQAVTASGAPVPPVPVPAAAAAGATAAVPAAAVAPGQAAAAPPANPQPVPGAAQPGSAQPPSTPGPRAIPWQQPAGAKPPTAPLGAPVSAAGAQPKPASPNGTAETPAQGTPPAPATAAAVRSPRSPTPPAASSPATSPAGAPAPGEASGPASGGVEGDASAAARPSLPPAPTAPRRASARTEAAGAAVPGRTAAAAAADAVGALVGGGARRRSREGQDTQGGGSRVRFVLVGIGLCVVIVLGVVLLTKGGSSPAKRHGTASTPTSSTATSTTQGKHHSGSKSHPKEAKAAAPAEIDVVVLNGTESTGLASRVSTQLQQDGYSQAAARYGQPPGANEVTVVEYASGHRADAAAVARSLSVTHVVPIEQGVAVLSGAAKVVVVVGADRATATP